MIISKKHGYVFIELPRTASTAVEKELIASYDGTRILKKHSTYQDFLRQASTEERSFFAFSSIRNPMDDAVSRYLKIRTDHNNRYSDPIRRKYRVGNRGSRAYRETGLSARGTVPERRSLIERVENRHYSWITRHDAEFPAYFLRFYHLPVDTWARLSHDQLDFIIRFESLEEDFAKALQMIGLDKIRPLPVKNPTSQKSRDFIEYYTPETQARARRVFGPYMRRWGYEFPPSWGSETPPLWAEIAYQALAVPRTIYWRLLR
ncbi:MAG: sulfotransferase family 2 domain-containing protein [Acidimicrobiia bacterium]